MVNFVNTGVLITSGVLSTQCCHWLNSAAVGQKPLSLKPNNMLFAAGETQADHCVSDGDPGY